MKQLFTASALVLALGCATQAKYKAAMDTWVGVDIDSYVMQNGIPKTVFSMQDGRKVYQYSDRTSNVTYQTMGAFTYAHDNSRSCDLSILVGTNNKIEHWTAQGNACVSK